MIFSNKNKYVCIISITFLYLQKFGNKIINGTLVYPHDKNFMQVSFTVKYNHVLLMCTCHFNNKISKRFFSFKSFHWL